MQFCFNWLCIYCLNWNFMDKGKHTRVEVPNVVPSPMGKRSSRRRGQLAVGDNSTSGDTGGACWRAGGRRRGRVVFSPQAAGGGVWERWGEEELAAAAGNQQTNDGIWRVMRKESIFDLGIRATFLLSRLDEGTTTVALAGPPTRSSNIRERKAGQPNWEKISYNLLIILLTTFQDHKEY
jgi:hypothetical protein